MQTVNIAAYKFVDIPDPTTWQARIKARCAELDLKGTVVLASEGINLFIAGTRESIDAFIMFLRYQPMFCSKLSNIDIKESICTGQPFKRMVVRLAKEIITMKHPTISPECQRAPSIDASTLKQWLDERQDDKGRELVLLDTRNNFEVDIGTFNGAMKLDLERFSDFPDKVRTTFEHDQSALQEKTFVLFCTGGIRCEKATLYMKELGFENIYQLDGGILRYFEHIGGEHFQGECFVFDERVAVDTQLNESQHAYDHLKWKSRRLGAVTHGTQVKCKDLTS